MTAVAQCWDGGTSSSNSNSNSSTTAGTNSSTTVCWHLLLRMLTADIKIRLWGASGRCLQNGSERQASAGLRNCGQPEGVLFVPVFIMAPGAKSINRAHVRPSVPWSSGTMGQGDSGQFNNGQVHNVTMSRWDIGPRDKRLRDNGPMSSETMDIGTKGTETMRRGTMYN